jgi:hypothetical protein
VAFTETGAKGWNLTGYGGATPAQGWMASWSVDGQPVEGTIRYLPAGIARKGLYVLPPALAAAFVAMLFGAWWRRRKARKAALKEAAA